MVSPVREPRARRQRHTPLICAVATGCISASFAWAQPTAVRSFDPTAYTPGQAILVTVTVTPDRATQAWAVEDQPPGGWTISTISHEGVLDTVTWKVKWGPFFDNQGYPGGQAYTLSYAARPPPDETGQKTFGGVASFDGVNVLTGGSLSLSPASTPPPPPPPPPPPASADADNDGVPDSIDNCPNVANVNQADTDRDGVGDACDLCPGSDDRLDADQDGVPDACDNCPDTPNPGQEDADGDGIGDACDRCPGGDDRTDTDGDGIPDACDNCPATANADQTDTDGDALGDACDPCPNDPSNDVDGDGVCGEMDNCPNTANPDQADADGDGTGDACDQTPDGGKPLPEPDEQGSGSTRRLLPWCGLGVVEPMLATLPFLLVLGNRMRKGRPHP